MPGGLGASPGARRPREAQRERCRGRRDAALGELYWLRAHLTAEVWAADGYDYLAGGAVLRLSNYLTPDQAARFRSAFESVAHQP